MTDIRRGKPGARYTVNLPGGTVRLVADDDGYITCRTPDESEAADARRLPVATKPAKTPKAKEAD